MRTPKAVKRADAKRNTIVDSKDVTKIFGEITILAHQTTWGDGRISRTISVFKTGAQRLPFEADYTPDLENYEFSTADEANSKFVELVNKYKEA